MGRSTPHLPILLVLLICTAGLTPSVSAANNDQSRLGTVLTGLSIYRSPPDPLTNSPGWNILRPSLGTPSQGVFNLTLTTGVNYVMVSNEADCGSGCTDGGGSFDTSTSTSYQEDNLAQTKYTYYNPTSIDSSDLTNITGSYFMDLIHDDRQDDVRRDMIALQDLGGDVLDKGISGYWGLGVDSSNATRSIIPQVLLSQGGNSFTVGLDMFNVSTSPNEQAGNLHWGAAVASRYNGDFRWFKPRINNTASFWTVDLGGLDVAKSGFDVTNVYATIDPGYNSILVPYTLAKSIYAKISGAVPDPSLAGRYIVACNTAFNFQVTLGDHKWNVPDSELVVPRTGATCYGTIRSWPQDSVPGTLGTMVLGTPFLSQVYSVLYYNPSQSYVGIAGKPGTANDLAGEYHGISAQAKAGIISGVLIGLIALLLYIFVQHRDSWEGMQNRMMRKQHKMMTAQMRMVNPMVIPIPSIAPQVAHIAQPLHAEVYAPPYVPTMSKTNEAMMGGNPNLLYTDDGGPPLHVADETGRTRREGNGFWGGWKNALNVRKWRNHNADVERHAQRQVEAQRRAEEQAMAHAHNQSQANFNAEAAARRRERHERRRSRRESRESREHGHHHHHHRHSQENRDRHGEHRHHHRHHRDDHTPDMTQSTNVPVTYTPEGYSTDQMGSYGNVAGQGYFPGAMGMQGGLHQPPGYMPGMMPSGMGIGQPTGMGGGMNQFGQYGPAGGMGMGMGVGSGGQMPYGYNQVPQQMPYGADEGYYGTPQQQHMTGSFQSSPGYGYREKPGLWDRLRGRS